MIINVTIEQKHHQRTKQLPSFVSKRISLLNRLSIFERSTLILILVIWILIGTSYVLGRFSCRIVSALKSLRYRYDSSSTYTNDKVCNAFIISNPKYQYGSTITTLTTTLRSTNYDANKKLPLFLVRDNDTISFSHSSDTTRSIANYQLNKGINNNAFQNCEKSKLHDIVEENAKVDRTMIEQYLKSYNPLNIDFSSSDQDLCTNIVDNVDDSNKIVIDDEINSTASVVVANPFVSCLPLSCTQKKYQLLKNDDEHEEILSMCSTKLTTFNLPVVMITDCSIENKPHTDIIEMEEFTNTMH
ncbi:unnamed protein product [Didymodactylos carnosus]|uniref:Uncharacterized protein n=1 Tax=Didymodactylos carnosus TaxID=1234261 RepID=A0A813U2G7_9BILA|nr:unnamed protein product [Didymodactylos carnosus]CAF0864096.1 unnamed protein product [Didymodactylos carnosus]CAF3604038.1 unnamed protein product [Didymodactylos carnosus]CAF3648860.1 unnamed protein product [Didymodactylos carnosus]